MQGLQLRVYAAHHLHSCLFLLIVLAVITLWTLCKSNLYVISIICACYLACRSNCTCIDNTCCSMTWECQTLLYHDISIQDVPYNNIHASCVIVQDLTWTFFGPLFLTLLYTHTPSRHWTGNCRFWPFQVFKFTT